MPIDHTEEKRLRERLAHLERVMQYNPSWIFTCKNDAQWTLISTNHGLTSMLGFTEKEFKKEHNNSIGSLIPIEDRMRTRCILSKLEKGEENVCYETPILTKSGDTRYMHVSVFISIEDNQEVLYASCVDITLLHKTQQERNEQAIKLNHMVNTIPGGAILFKISEGFKTVYYSDSIPALTGRTKEEYDVLIKDDAIATVYPPDKPRIRDMAHHALYNPNGTDEIYRLVCKNGDIVWVHGFSKMIGTQDGDPLLYLVLINMSQETKLYKEALDQTNEMIIVTDADTYELLYCNKAASEYGGKEQGAYVGTHCYEHIYNCNDICSHCIANRFTSDKLSTFETERCGRYYSVKGRVIDWNGRNAVIEYVSDITDSHNTAITAMLDRDMLMLAMKMVYPVCVAVNLTKNSYHMIEYQDIATKKAIESGCFDDLMTLVSTSIHTDERKSFYDTFSRESLLKAYHNGNDRIQVTHRIIGDDAIWHWNEITVIFIPNKYNDDILEVAITRCIDDEKSKEQQKAIYQRELEQALTKAENADKSKTDFLANISHDMRTPLNSIIGFTTLAIESDNNDERNDFLNKIASSSKYLLGLINDTLDLSKLELGKITLCNEEVLSSELISNILTTQMLSAKSKGVDLKLKKINTKNIVVKTDSLRVQEVFINLLSNAIKFTPSGGTVTISVERINATDKTVTNKITVSDTGIGMSDEFAKKAFEPFAQENPYDTLRSGTGLGLAIVKEIVELMGGTITLETKKGFGTTFCVILEFELAENQDININQTSKISTVLNGKKILLCEDHPLNIELAKRLLEKQGIEVFIADNGKKGVTAFKKSPSGFFDAILMDIRMPVMNGLEATSAIRALNREDAKNVPIIAMTANAYDEDKNKSIKAGMTAHISKPINPILLFDTLKRSIK